MPQFQSTRHVSHSASAMLALVADVERYPEFVPYCLACKVLRRATTPDGKPTFLSQMTIGYGPLRESFVTRATLDAPNLKLLVQYVDGPFRRLENRWSFRDTPGGSDVVFAIDYAFKSRAFELLAGSVFDRLFRKMADAFVERADALAGQGSPLV
jgi:coenzyme Q-binding protein COQ10